MRPLLEKGQIVDIIAPGFASSESDLLSAIQYLKQKGFNPRVPDQLLQPTNFHSNTDEARWEHLRRALLAKDSQVIWCLRGGYGSNRLLPFLAKLKKPAKKKLLIGISDVTSLHIFLNQKWKWPSLHASLLDRVAKGMLPADLESELWGVLTGNKQQIQHQYLKPLNQKAEKIKKLKANLIGGNLTVLQSLLGTPWKLDLKNKFLAIEDLGERGYRVDRILEHFRQAGVWKGCKGLLVGEFTGGNEPNSETSLCMSAIQRFADLNLLPVINGLEIGHGARQRSLWLGSSAEIKQEGSQLILTSFGVGK